MRRFQIKKFHKTGTPNEGIPNKNTTSKFSKTKNQTQKDPLNFQKSKKYIYKEASNQKVL